MWGVNIYSVVSGVSTMIFSSNWIYPGDVITIDGLEAGDYEYEIRDDQPCTYPPVPFTLNCTPFTACDPPTIPHGGYSITSATSNDGCTTDNGDGTHEITTVNLDPGSSTYTVQYYEISGPTWPAATATAIGPLQGPASGGISLSPPIGYYNLEAFSTNQQNYAVVITDNLNCELVQAFTVDCASIVTNPCAGYTSSSGPTLSTDRRESRSGCSSVVQKRRLSALAARDDSTSADAAPIRIVFTFGLIVFLPLKIVAELLMLFDAFFQFLRLVWFDPHAWVKCQRCPACFAQQS